MDGVQLGNKKNLAKMTKKELIQYLKQQEELLKNE